MRASSLSIISIIGLIGATPSAFGQIQGPGTFTLDGQLFSSPNESAPMLDAAVTIKTQVLNAAENCILYEETQVQDTRSTNGYFNIQVGAVTATRTSGDSGNLLINLFSNRAPIVGKQLSNGTTPCSYTPTSGDLRHLRVTVTASADNIAHVLAPNMTIDSVPNAMVAESSESLQGYVPANFLVLGQGSLNQNNVENIFSNTNYSRLMTLLSVSPSSYLQTNSNNSISVPANAATPSAPAAGQVWYDSGSGSLKFWNGSTVQSLLATTSSAYLPAGNGSAVTSLNANNISSGTISEARLPSSVVRSNLPVTGQINSNQYPNAANSNPVANTTTVDFNNGNLQILGAALGSGTITLNNMQDGGSYKLIVTDTTSRTYTFANCTISHFQPANSATTAGTQTVYTILKTTIGGATHCYIDWTTGYN